jgi:holo-[acyl-carrier protein] synthase
VIRTVKGMRLGLDLVTVDELSRLAVRPWFTRYVFADVELDHGETLTGARRDEFLAGRFAAKEAVLKLLGVGLFQGVLPRDIALEPLPTGAPAVCLRDTAARAARLAGVTQVTVSITHKQGLAAAVAIGW